MLTSKVDTSAHLLSSRMASFCQGSTWFVFAVVTFAAQVPLEALADVAKPRKIHIAIAGGGEARDKENQFDSSLPGIAGLAQKGWETRLHYDFGHPSTKPLTAKLKLSSLTEMRPLAGDEVSATFLELKARLLSTESRFKKGDQILISIDSHGSKGPDGNHYVSLAGDGVMNLVPYIKVLIPLAQKKGIKLGLVFDSCFSGNAIQEIERTLATTSNVCLISSSAVDRISYGAMDSDSTFAGMIQSSKTLEEGFLAYRTKLTGLNTVPHLPSISSTAGRHAQTELLEVTKYLFSDTDVPKNNLLCANPGYSMFPGITFRQADLQSEVARSYFAKHADADLDKLQKRIQSQKAKRDEIDLELDTYSPFPGYDWNTCQQAVHRANPNRLEELRAAVESAISSTAHAWPTKNRQQGEADLEPDSKSLQDIRYRVCSLIHDSGGLLDMGTARAQLTALERLKRRPDATENSPKYLTGSESEKIIESEIRQRKKELDQMNALWRNSTMRKVLQDARASRKVRTQLERQREEINSSLRSPETVITEREAWLQIYGNYKKKNPNEHDPCAEFEI